MPYHCQIGEVGTSLEQHIELRLMYQNIIQPTELYSITRLFYLGSIIAILNFNCYISIILVYQVIYFFQNLVSYMNVVITYYIAFYVIPSLNSHNTH